MIKNGITTYYEYDKNNRLLTEKYSLIAGETTTTAYVYDNNGNQISKTISKEKNEVTGQAEQITAINLAEDTTETITLNEYDGFNQLKKVSEGNGIYNYAYNGDGLRISKSINTTVTNHVWDGDQIVLEFNAAGTITNKYLRGINLIYSEDGSGNKKYYLFNAHGDVVQLTNTAGDVTKAYEYDAFGVEKNPDANDANVFRYCGEYFDNEIGTIYLRARYYDPGIGRFITEDSYPGKDNDPLSLNLYTYCENNAVNLYDPSGHIPYFRLEWLKLEEIEWFKYLSNNAHEFVYQLASGIDIQVFNGWGLILTGKDPDLVDQNSMGVRFGLAAGVLLDKGGDNAFSGGKITLKKGISSKGWKVGDDVCKPTAKGNEPAWNTVKSRFWKNEAVKPDAVEKYGSDNVAKMKNGNAPQRYNPDKDGMESMELSHEPIPQRDGGKDFIPRWPQDHAGVDPYRRPGY